MFIRLTLNDLPSKFDEVVQNHKHTQREREREGGSGREKEREVEFLIITNESVVIYHWLINKFNEVFDIQLLPITHMRNIIKHYHSNNSCVNNNIYISVFLHDTWIPKIFSIKIRIMVNIFLCNTDIKLFHNKIQLKSGMSIHIY